MAYADTSYAARLGLEQIEKGRANVIKCPVYRSGALVAPSSGSVTIFDAAGSEVVSAGSVSISGSVAQYTVASAVVAASALGDGWAVEWALSMPDSTVHTFRTDAALVRRMLYPTVSDIDLFARLPALDPTGTAPITAAADYQNRLDEAWRIIVRRLCTDGHLPWLVTDAHAFRESHIALTLHLVMRDLAIRSAGGDYYADQATAYRTEYELAYRGTRIRLDRDEDGTPETTRKAAAPIVWMGGGPRWLT